MSSNCAVTIKPSGLKKLVKPLTLKAKTNIAPIAAIKNKPTTLSTIRSDIITIPLSSWRLIQNPNLIQLTKNKPPTASLILQCLLTSVLHRNLDKPQSRSPQNQTPDSSAIHSRYHCEIRLKLAYSTRKHPHPSLTILRQQDKHHK